MNYRIKPEFLETAKAAGIPTVKLVYMVNHAAPFGRSRNMRRYQDYIFRVDDGEVTRFITPEYKNLNVVCEDCNNDGQFCLTCNSTGYASKRKALVDPVTDEEITLAKGGHWNDQTSFTRALPPADRAHHRRPVSGNRATGTVG